MSSFTLTNNKQKMAAQNSDFSDSGSSEAETLLSFHDQGGGNDKKVIQHNNVFSDLKLKKVNLGIQETNLFLPFLIGSRKLAECRVCENVINPGEKVSCSIHDCRVSYHLKCAKEHVGLLSSSKRFKCRQHACYLCKKKAHLWPCSKCDLAAHRKCAAYPGYVKGKKPSAIICWRHSTDWPPSKSEVPTSSIEEVFCRLPLPYAEEEFKIDPMWKCTLENNLEPSPYEHIKRNIYRIKKEGDNVDDSIGCAHCDSGTCIEDCQCRLQSISCSSACGCSEILCTNRPFKENKKIKIVMTNRCGWGLEADEFIGKGEFIIEYVGEVISEALCQKRFWGMKEGANCYMCEVRKGFIIDATFKGNESRFLNHSCDPNCNLEKWEVDGETRLGVFAKRSIKRGEPLTYHYGFVRFGPEIECYCGSSNCEGYLGAKKKMAVLRDWGAKRQRVNF